MLFKWHFLWEIIAQKVPFSDAKSYEVPAKLAAGEVGKVGITVYLQLQSGSNTRQKKWWHYGNQFAGYK